MTVYAVKKPVKEPKGKKKKRIKKTPEQSLKENIDDLDSMICLIVNDFICIVCGGTANQNHHFFHKGNHGAIRFDPDNHCPVEFGCHNYTIHTRGDTEDLRDNLIKRIGQERFDQLKIKSKQRAEWTITSLREELKNKIDRLDIVTRMYPERIDKLSEAAKKRLVKYEKV